jgi:upstream activation factor subunit UAF30
MANALSSKMLNLSPELEAVVGSGPMPRTIVTQKLWVYIKANNLQDPANKKNIIADDKLRKIFGQDSVDMFKMTGLVSKHMTPSDAPAAAA